MVWKQPIGVGIIGANPDRGWALNAHVPALRSLPAYRIAAVSTSQAATARRAGELYGVPAFDNARDLAAHPDVDLVAVTVKVPTHFDLVGAALDAGKHVYCEWPLGRTLAEAEQMTARAQSLGVHAFAGLQARSAPAVRQARALVAQGYVGTVLSTSVIAQGGVWSDVIDTANAYTNDISNGATMLTIPFGHAIDALCWTLGEFAEVAAVTTVRQKQVRIMETGETMTKTAPDQVMVAGLLQGGAAISIHYRGGNSVGPNFLWEINGDKGYLRIEADFGHLQIAPSRLFGSQGGAAPAPIQPAAEYVAAPGAPAGAGYNVAQSYALLLDDVATGSHHVATFADAVQRHKMIEAIEQSAATGRRVQLAG